MTVRAVPFYCPYCAEQTIEPRDDATYYCSSCDRTFSLRFLRIGELPPED